MRLLFCAAVCLLAGPALARPWVMDPASTITVDADWQGTTVPVRFPSFAGTIDFDETKVEATRAAIAVATTDATTGLAPVDALVRSADYLGTANWPRISFRLDKLTQTSKSTADILGQITLRGVTRPITFHARLFRLQPSQEAPQRMEAGFDLTGQIDRTQFGSTGGVPEVAGMLPIRIHLLMRSQ
ncbi:MAG: YceI family protein [Paracoccaceae bacterium]